MKRFSEHRDKRKRNHLIDVWLLLLFVIVLTLGLFFIPTQWGDWELKKADILSELRRTQAETQTASEKQTSARENNLKDSLARMSRIDSIRSSLQKKHNATARQLSDTVPLLSYIEDYTPSRKGLVSLFQGLKQHTSPVYIAFVGDSFIEGDIFTFDVRRLLQQKWGGWGSGWLPLASNVSGFRKGLKHTFSAWDESTIINKKGNSSSFLLSGRCFKNKGAAQVTYEIEQPLSSSPQVGKLFYNSPKEIPISYTMADSTVQVILPAGAELQCLSIALTSSKIKLQFPSATTPEAVFYGFSAEGNKGVAVDNFSMRSNSGLALSSMNSSSNNRFHQLRPYKLIVLQFGLNVANAKQTDYSSYGKRMIAIVEQIKKDFPNAAILIMGVSDRGQRKNGNFETMDGILALRDEQRRIAQKAQVLFWDTFTAMGGANSMREFVASGRAAKDYTHITFSGGRFLAERFVEALLFEKSCYDSL